MNTVNVRNRVVWLIRLAVSLGVVGCAYGLKTDTEFTVDGVHVRAQTTQP